MKVSLPVLALVLATGFPLAACAQSNAAENGPTPEMRAQMQQARDGAKTAAFNDLSPATRAKVQSILDQINNGQLTDIRSATQQLDAALSPSEAKAVLGERDKMMGSLRANMPARPEGAPAGGPPQNGMTPTHGAGGGRHATAGRFLLQVGVDPAKMRALRQAQMQQMQGQPKPQ